MILRIFLPECIFRLNSISDSECYQLFGSIARDNNGVNTSVFIVDVHKSSGKETSRQNIIGIISKGVHYDELPKDYILFRVNEIKSVLELKSIHLPSFIPCGASIQTQLFLYDSKIFSDLSQRNENDCQRIDPISQLIVLIKNNNELISKEKCRNIVGDERSIRCRIISFLVSLATFSQSRLSFLNSSFLKHFHFWAINLEKLTGKR